MGQYKARATNRIGIDDDEAQLIGEALERIGEESGEAPGPESIVAAARRETSVLHEYFDWDDERAAHAHRLAQARQITRSVVVVVRNTREEDVEVPAFGSLERRKTARAGARGHEEEERGYVQVEEVLSDEQKRHSALESLVRRMYASRDELTLYEEMEFLVSELDRSINVVEMEDAGSTAGRFLEQRAAG